MNKPLAHRLRPEKLSEIFGQEHLIGENKILTQMIKQEKLLSMIFYGPSGVGKTTLAMVLASELKLPYRLFNAVINNKKDLTIIFEEAKLTSSLIVIIEEIHRLNKDKQDLLLPHLEAGTITVIGTTTANPYYAINPAIRSRCHLFEVKALNEIEIIQALEVISKNENEIGRKITLDIETATIMAKLSNGDLRYAINLLELALLATPSSEITKEIVLNMVSESNQALFKDDNEYYDLLSAFQKSIRGSDVNAALYYLAQLIIAEDLESIERRLLATAYEDIGLANPAAVSRAVLALEAAKKIGFPEARLALANAVIELALSPKSKSANLAIDLAIDNVKNNPLLMPEYLRLAPVGLSEADKYPYDRYDLHSKIQYLPNRIKDIEFYQPFTSSQFENILASNYNKLKQTKRSSDLKTLKK